MTSLTIQPRGKPLPKLPLELEIPLSATVDELQDKIASKTGVSRHRLRLTKASDRTALTKGALSLEESGLNDKSTVFVKDLGPQISWRLVYFIEYLGPLLIHPTFFFLRDIIYAHPIPLIPEQFQLAQKAQTSLFSSGSTMPEPDVAQKVACLLITLHFIKRELETLFVHRFSAATMPVSFVFRNSSYYWLVGGVSLAYPLYAPKSQPYPQNELEFGFFYAAIGLWTFAELANYNAHRVLRNLRPAGSTVRGIPKGFGFSAVPCPNYSFEVLGWVAMTIATRSIAVGIFAAIGAFVMRGWAKKREYRYRKEFGAQYKKKRSMLIPGIW